MPNPEVVYIQTDPSWLHSGNAAANDAALLSFDEWKEAWGTYKDLRKRGFDDRMARMTSNLREAEMRCEDLWGWECDCVLEGQSCPACRGEARKPFGDSIPYEF